MEKKKYGIVSPTRQADGKYVVYEMADGTTMELWQVTSDLEFYKELLKLTPDAVLVGEVRRFIRNSPVREAWIASIND